MHKVCSDKLTAGMLSGDFKEKVREFIAIDQTFSFMSCIKGTPAYWKKFLFDVLAMVKQLRIPTFFLTLSCADLRWNELISIIGKLNKMNFSESDIINFSYQDRCNLLNSNPVLVARHFQYRLEVLFKEIAIDGPLGKTKYYAIRVEFQIRGRPHIHSFLWVVYAPTLTKDNKEEYIAFVDTVIHAVLPHEAEQPELYKLVTTYQLHRHSKTCRKYKNESCRFHFGRFFSKRTIVAEPLPPNMPENEKLIILDRSQDNFVEVKSISEVLNELGIDEFEYERALGISDNNGFQLHLKRPTNSCFVNNYFDVGLLAWEANMDIQPVFNHYKAVTCMCSYLSKQEDECSQAMKQAVKEAFAHAYSSKRECSVQESVYHIMPELWIRKIFPGVIYANSNLPEKRIKMILSEKEIAELPDDSTDLYKRNMIDSYIDRPALEIIENLCFAEFLKRYQLVPKAEENDCQPEELHDGIIKNNHSFVGQYHRILTTSSKEKLKCPKVNLVLRYNLPNRHKEPEAYAHHLLFMFYPFRVESELKSGEPPSYFAKLNEPGVIDIINFNKALTEPFSDLVDEAFLHFRTELTSNFDSYAQQENDETEQDQFESSIQVDNSTNGDHEIDGNTQTQNAEIRNNSMANILHDDEINAKIRSLNFKEANLSC